MSKEFLQRAKLRLAYLGIGLAIGLIVASIIGASYNQILKVKETAFEERLSHLQKLSQVQIKETKRLLSENQKLRTTKIERTNADGSKEVIEKTASDSSSSEAESSRDVAMLEHTVATLKQTHKRELEMEQKKRPSLTANIGITTSLVPYVALTYNIYGPVILGAYVDKTAKIGLGLGIQF